MTKTYCPMEHTDVVVKNFSFDGRPLSIVHVTHNNGPKPARVWVMASYADTLSDGMVVVGDGLSDGYDIHGNRIVSVDASLCTFYTEEEANDIARAIACDEQLLGYAR